MKSTTTNERLADVLDTVTGIAPESRTDFGTLANIETENLSLPRVATLFFALVFRIRLDNYKRRTKSTVK